MAVVLRMLLPPKVVGIAGGRAVLRIRTRDDSRPDVRVRELPANLLRARPDATWTSQPIGELPELETEWCLEFDAVAPGRGVMEVAIFGAMHRVPVVVFQPREFFLCMVLSSNHHIGWDPLSYIFGGTDEDLQLEGDAWPKVRQLEAMYHKRGLPITWFIDEKVAAKAAHSIAQWHNTFGDDFGVMPSSLIHHNARNDNLGKRADQVTEEMRATLEATQGHFPFFTTTLAIDQFIGSVGSHFTEAAFRLGMRGLWGVGFDHGTCDTSMFHRGCPWDVYRPDRANYRIPANHASRLWMYQWTTRDIVPTLHSPDDGPSGSVIFSTDPDDVRSSRIMHEQPDYWERFFKGYRVNFDADAASPLNECFVFLMHQEDHDCHFPENADYLRSFLDACAAHATPATLEEVNAWLDLKYGDRAHPTQAMVLEDALRCHDKVVWYCNQRVPADWPAAGATYPPMLAFYDAHAMACFNEREALPFRFFDYDAHTIVAEKEVYPECDLRGEVTCRDARLVRDDETWRFTAVIESMRAFERVPIAIWNAFGNESAKADMIAPDLWRVGRHVVVFIEIEKGKRTVKKDF